MTNQEKDFAKLVSLYLLSVCVILIILPINKKWWLVGGVLVFFGGVLEWYWHKNFKR